MLLEQLLKLTPPDHAEIPELQAATLAYLVYLEYHDHAIAYLPTMTTVQYTHYGRTLVHSTSTSYHTILTMSRAACRPRSRWSPSSPPPSTRPCAGARLPRR